MHLRGLLLGLVLSCLGAGCSENSGEAGAPPETVPPFAYSLYLNITPEEMTPKEGADEALARRPEHLEHIYQLRLEETEAKYLFGWLESQFSTAGATFADVTALACGLDLPIRCTPDWEFVDRLLGYSEGPGAQHLRRVLAESFSKQAKKRKMETALALTVANAVLARGQLKATVGKAATSAETRAVTGATRRTLAEATAAAQGAAALEQRAAAAGAERLVVATGRLRAPAELSAMQARLVEAEALEVGSRQTAVLEDLARLRPRLDRPASGVSAGETLWSDYVTYWGRRFGELSEVRRAGVLPPMSWEGYRRFRTRFERALKFQHSATAMLRRELEELRVDENVGLRHEGSDSPTYYVDQLGVDETTLEQDTPRVESFSTKQRDFTQMDSDAVTSQVRADAREALAKYGGTVEIRRPNHPLFESRVTVSRVHLVYDEAMLPELPNLRRQMGAAAKDVGVELFFHHEP